MNPGLAYGCQSTSIIFTSLMSRFVFKERMSIKMAIGILVIIFSVIILCLAGNYGSYSSFENLNIKESD
jgi:drug/metabolite transporter (DMT)-like permease